MIKSSAAGEIIPEPGNKSSADSPSWYVYDYFNHNHTLSCTLYGRIRQSIEYPKTLLIEKRKKLHTCYIVITLGVFEAHVELVGRHQVIGTFNVLITRMLHDLKLTTVACLSKDINLNIFP